MMNLTRKSIYVADDEENIREILQNFLEEAGFHTVTFENGDLLYDAFVKEPSDMVILDIMMPGTDGIAVCKKLREISDVPIIILTARDSEMDYTHGILSGGDDYLTKPFAPSVLVLRIKALFRRIEMEHKTDNNHEQEQNLNFNDLNYLAGEHRIECNGGDLGLTETELSFLKYMLSHKDNAVSREDFLDRIWGIEADVETRVTDETVRRIRKKLRAAGSQVTIQTVWGYGYRLGVAK